MRTRERLARLEKAAEALLPAAPPPPVTNLQDWSNGELTLALVQLEPEVAERFEHLTWFLSEEATAAPGKGLFDTDPEFRPAWDHFVSLWFHHGEGCGRAAEAWSISCCDFWGRPPAHPKVRTAQARVRDIMRRVLLAEPKYAVLAKLFPPPAAPAGEAPTLEE